MGNTYPLFVRSKDPIGGAEINMYYLALEFSKLPDYKVTFIVNDYGQSFKTEIDNVTLVKLKYNGKGFNKLHHILLRRIYYLYALFKTKANIYLLSGASEISLYVMIYARLKKRKTVFRVAHDMDIDGTYSELGFNYKIIAAINNFVLKKIDKVVCQNTKQLQLLKQKYNIDALFIKNGIPLYEHNKTAKNSILWVGKNNTIKRPELYLELAKQLKDFQFIMICNGLSDELVAKYSSSNLTVIKNVPFFEIKQYYLQAKCLVSTSSKEGFPNVFIQACASKTPILSFKVNPSNFITEHNLGFVCNDNMQEAITFIESLSAEKIDYYGKNGYDYVKHNHDIKKTFDDYKKLTEELIS